MPSIRFLIQHAKQSQNDKQPNRNYPVYIRLVNGRKKDIKVKTDFSVPLCDWNLETQSPRKNARELSIALNGLNLKIQSSLLEASKNGEEINSAWLKKIMNIEPEESKPKTLLDYLEYYLEKRETELSDGNKKRIGGGVKGMIERFQKAKKKLINGTDVNMDFKRDFERYGKDEGYAHNTIQKTLKFIKSICTFAAQDGFPTSTELGRFKFKFHETEVVFLTEEEIEQIIKVELPTESLDNARDWLIISCYTGQRHSDFSRFSKAMIKMGKDKNGKPRPYLDFSQLKTSNKMMFPLPRPIEPILEKRNGDFPRSISLQKYNDYIKEVCKASGIDKETTGLKFSQKTKKKKKGQYPKYELVSSHIGRRSFATNYYMKIPTSIIMAVTGHKSEAQLRAYIGKADYSRAIELTDYI